MRVLIAASIATLLAATLACEVAQQSQRARRVKGTGVVEAVDAELKQVVIDHA